MDQGMKTFPPRSAQIPSTWVGALAWNVLLCRLADASPCARLRWLFRRTSLQPHPCAAASSRSIVGEEESAAVDARCVAVDLAVVGVYLTGGHGVRSTAEALHTIAFTSERQKKRSPPATQAAPPL